MLETVLTTEAYQFMLVFCRIGAAFMVLPLISASFINIFFRLSLALAISFLILPDVVDSFPKMPTSGWDLFLLFFFEITKGIFIGLIPVFLLVCLDLAGHNMGLSLGFSNATMFDPTSSSQSMLTNTFVSYVALLIILATNLHHLMLGALVESYFVFVPTQGLMTGDMANVLSQTLTNSFKIGFEISAPFIVFSIILNVGMGILSRLLPQLNVLFLVMPMQSFGGIALLMIVIPSIMICAMDYFGEGLSSFMVQR